MHNFHVFTIWEGNKRIARQVGLSVVGGALFPLACVVMTSHVFLAQSHVRKMSNKIQ